MQKSGKRGLIALAVLVALGAAAFGTIRYVESAVAKSTRIAIESFEGVTNPKVAEVSYAFFGNTLTLNGVSFVMDVATLPDQSAQIQIDKVVVTNPNLDLIKETHVFKGVEPIADQLTLEGYKVVAPGSTLTLARSAYTSFSANLETLNKLKAGEPMTQEDWFPVAVSLNYASIESEKLELSTEIPAARATLGKVIGRDGKGFSLGSMQCQNMEVFVAEKKMLTLTAMELENMSLAGMEKLTPAQLSLLMKASEADPGAVPPREAIEIAKTIFSDKTPLFGRLTLRDFKLDGPTTTTFDELSIRDFTLSPPAFSLAIKNLVLPLDAEPSLAKLRLLGIDKLNLSSDLSMNWPKKGSLFSTLALRLTDLCDLTFKSETLFDPDFNVFELQTYMGQEPLFGFVEVSLRDDGVMGRAARLAQTMLGVTPEQSVDFIQGLLSAELSGTPEQQEQLTKLLSVVKNPGELTISITPRTPVTADELELVVTEPGVLSISAKPGPKTLRESMPQ